MKNYKNKNQKGYAILFTVVIVSAISVITAGLSNAAYKQLILSSLAKDSQTAFYEADTASDCALYVDQVEYNRFLLKDPTTNPSIFYNLGDSWNCGDVNLEITDPDDNLGNGYSLNPPSDVQNSNEPCFRIQVDKETETDPDDPGGDPIINTTISAKGYNICNKNNSKTVEREIQIKY